MHRSGPVLAVLPFKTDTGAEDDSILAQGFVEELSGELSRFRTFEVIAPVSGLAVGDLTETEAAARLGASHILRGRLKRDGNRLRVSVRLVNGQHGTQLWNERLETVGNSVFEVQDDVVCRIAASLAARLDDTTLRMARRKPPESLEAHELTLRGLTLLREGSLETDEGARALFERALKIDPNHARAHAGLSMTWFNDWSCQFWHRYQKNGQLAYEHAHRALGLDDTDAMINLVIGRVLLYYREFEGASWYLDRAVALCPNDSELLIQLSICQAFLGRPELGVEHAERAMRLNPYHPNYYYVYAIFPYFAARDFATVLRLCNRIVGIPFVDFPVHAAIAHSHFGQTEEAQRQIRRYHDEFRTRITLGREPQAGEPLQWLLHINPYRRAEDTDFLAERFRALDRGHPYRAAVRSPRRDKPAATGSITVRRSGGWLVTYAGQQAVLPDLKGLQDIQRLLAKPGVELHCLDLTERQDEAFTGESALDDRARQSIKARISDLQEELAQAEDMNDAGRAERCRSELDQLIEQLSKALGLGGRGRKIGDLAERARTTVRWRIRHAICKMEKEHPRLSRHLVNSIRTGTFCSYQPEEPHRWEITE